MDWVDVGVGVSQRDKHIEVKEETDKRLVRPHKSREGDTSPKRRLFFKNPFNDFVVDFDWPSQLMLSTF